MIDEILGKGTAMIQWDARLTAITGVLLIFVLTRAITSLRSNLALRGKGDDKTPPLIPYSASGLGNLISFAFDTKT